MGYDHNFPLFTGKLKKSTVLGVSVCILDPAKGRVH